LQFVCTLLPSCVQPVCDFFCQHVWILVATRGHLVRNFCRLEFAAHRQSQRRVSTQYLVRNMGAQKSSLCCPPTRAGPGTLSALGKTDVTLVCAPLTRRRCAVKRTGPCGPGVTTFRGECFGWELISGFGGNSSVRVILGCSDDVRCQ
jgi:hypothetical protein